MKKDAENEIIETLGYIVKNMTTKSELDKMGTNLIQAQQDIKELKVSTLEIRNSVDNAFGKLELHSLNTY